MRIGIDCRLSGLAHAGIGRYIENLILRLPSLDQDLEWVYFFNHHRQWQQVLTKADHQQQLTLNKVKTIFSPTKHYSLAEQVKLPLKFSRAQLDLLHIPHFNAPIFYPGKLVVTIHDLLWHQHRGSQVTTLHPNQYWLKYLAYRFVTTQAVRKAQVIIVPAETIKDTLNHYYPGVDQKTKVTFEGVDTDLQKKVQSPARRLTNTLLYVGSLYPHKNIEVVLKALVKLPDWQLWLIGSRNIFQDRTRQLISQLGIKSQVKFLGYVDDQQLAVKISEATALIQPSLSEGFGLTGLEAMSLGTPIVVSDIPIFHEIYQSGAIFFNPQDADELVIKINDLARLQPSSTQLKKITHQYSWDRMASQTLDIYRQALAG